MQRIWAEQALVGDEWLSAVSVEIGADGRIAGIVESAPRQGTTVGALLPAPANLHSHAFQRAMAGMTERRGPTGRDSFWTWRELMFRFLEALTPDDIEAITTYVQMEMLEAGYAAVGEFHYVHHQPDGSPYDDPGELSARIAAAADLSGIGLTLLPVLYQQGGCDGSPLAPGQIRFGNTLDQFTGLFERTRKIVEMLPDDSGLGIAPHSLRAVSRESLTEVAALASDLPLHMHLAEQAGEVMEVLSSFGQRPVEWLLDHHDVDARWCLIHCTQMSDVETERLARSGAVAGLCPITESSLGDGIFNGSSYLSQGGRFGVGSDSNIRIALAEELRTLEYSQRLRDRHRAILASETKSTGRTIFERVVAGGAQAIKRDAGGIAVGRWADLIALDMGAVDLEGRHGDDILDSFAFAGDDTLISNVWSAGRHLVQGGQHVRRRQIESRYRHALRSLTGRI